MRIGFVFCMIAALCFSACSKEKHKVVVCIPVYGQSLALGEEAVRVTDFDSLADMYDGRIVTEHLDHRFGFFDGNSRKQWVKKLLHYTKRSYELSVYGMAESLAAQLGEDTLICVFPGGQGATPISALSKGTPPYQRLLDDIRLACDKSRRKGWDFVVPAVCWMQGESDLFDYTDVDYKQALGRFARDVSKDVCNITHQSAEVRIISYQTNLVSNAYHFQPDSFRCVETAVPEAQMELVRDDVHFWASGPTYPYSFARELKHIDGVGQKRLGYLAASSALSVLRGGKRQRGLVPLSAMADGNEVMVAFNVPRPPLALDTLLVRKVAGYGFSVITLDNRNILSEVSVMGNVVRLQCTAPAVGCRVRYAVNGEPMKSGWERGPRGNLRDSQGDAMTVSVQGTDYPLYNWCWQFDMLLK